MARTKTYLHFCPVARSLEVIGEKWSLLIVRDLLAGPRRFTDLLRGLGAITPKWLTQRLRELEGAGILERVQEEGRREVWYQLLPKGRELAPVVGALNVWGMRHAIREPLPDEAINASRLVVSFRAYLINRGLRPAAPVAWLFRFRDRDPLVLAFDGRHWADVALAEETQEADLTIDTSLEGWVAMLGTHETAGNLALGGSPRQQAIFQSFLDDIIHHAIPA